MRSKDQILLENLYIETYFSEIIDDEVEENEMEPLYIKGEYWFDESGTPMYADGDVGDMNHEMYVQDRCAGDVLGYFNIYSDDQPAANLDNHINEIVQILIKKLGIVDDEEKIEEIENDPYDALIDYLKTKTTMSGPIDEIVHIARGGGADGREFAIKEWGWSRVHQNHIEVKELTPKQLKIVASGINSALGEEGVYTDEDWLRASQSEYNISTYTGKRYEIKLEDMEKGNVQGLERADIEQPITAATQQVRQMDVEQTPSFYKGQLGDSYIPSFSQYFTESKKSKSKKRKKKRFAGIKKPNDTPQIKVDENTTFKKYLVLKESLVQIPLDTAYEIFKNEYDRSTGTSWSYEKFMGRARAWEFYGDEKGYVAIRRQRSGLVKLVGMAGDNRSKLKGINDLISMNMPLWGMVSKDIKDIAVRRGMREPNFLERQVLKRSIPPEVLGGAEILEYQKDGGIKLQYPDVGIVVKYLVGTPQYYAKLRTMIGDKVKEKILG